MTPEAVSIAEQIYVEMERAAAADGVRFDDEQRGYIKQALADAALEVHRRARAAAVPRGTSEKRRDF